VSITPIRAIIARYFDEQSVEKLNLDAIDCNTITTSPVTRSMFDSAEEHILRLLETSCVLKYKESGFNQNSEPEGMSVVSYNLLIIQKRLLFLAKNEGTLELSVRLS
jgi:hypothetical protein